MNEKKYKSNKSVDNLLNTARKLDKTEKKANFSIGFKIATDFVASIFVGALIGLGFDKLLSTKPIFFLIFLILGIAGAFLNIYRTILKLEKRK
tara:strand:+ start:3680 stop:3958 length:279 start_codon:yes stop_codon:yes gene_type:complete